MMIPRLGYKEPVVVRNGELVPKEIGRNPTYAIADIVNQRDIVGENQNVSACTELTVDCPRSQYLGFPGTSYSLNLLPTSFDTFGQRGLL